MGLLLADYKLSFSILKISIKIQESALNEYFTKLLIAVLSFCNPLYENTFAAWIL